MHELFFLLSTEVGLAYVCISYTYISALKKQLKENCITRPDS